MAGTPPAITAPALSNENGTACSSEPVALVPHGFRRWYAAIDQRSAVDRNRRMSQRSFRAACDDNRLGLAKAIIVVAPRATE
jgi:hypothetical protein